MRWHHWLWFESLCRFNLLKLEYGCHRRHRSIDMAASSHRPIVPSSRRTDSKRSENKIDDVYEWRWPEIAEATMEERFLPRRRCALICCRAVVIYFLQNDDANKLLKMLTHEHMQADDKRPTRTIFFRKENNVDNIWSSLDDDDNRRRRPIDMCANVITRTITFNLRSVWTRNAAFSPERAAHIIIINFVDVLGVYAHRTTFDLSFSYVRQRKSIANTNRTNR